MISVPGYNKTNNTLRRYLMSTQNISTVRNLYSGFNKGDVPLLMSLVTDDFELIDVALGLSWHGKQGWGEWLQNWATSMPDAQTHLDRIVAEGDIVVTEHHGGGTHTGPLQTPAGVIPPTGKTIALKFAEVFEMRDGKIRVLRVYWDTATLMRQLGLMPSPQAT
jgi:steroid delta-isomerase-like uncharacterized protein